MRNFFLLAVSLGLFACSSHPVSSANALSGSQKNFTNMTAYQNQAISVTLSSGTADFHDINANAAFNTATVRVMPNKVMQIELKKAGDNFFNSSVILLLMYKQGELWIDGVSPDKASPLSLNSTWINGYKYTDIYTHGLASLRGTTVDVRLEK